MKCAIMGVKQDSMKEEGPPFDEVVIKSFFERDI
jgi:hypothetical protein